MQEEKVWLVANVTTNNYTNYDLTSLEMMKAHCNKDRKRNLRSDIDDNEKANKIHQYFNK